MPNLPHISLQMYSLRQFQDIREALSLAQTSGFTGVEFAGYGDLNADELKAELTKRSLRSVSAHIAMERLETALDEEIALHQSLGTRWFVIPFHQPNSRDDVLTLAKCINAVLPAVKENGFTLAYHNHNHEFGQADGQYYLDILLNEVPDLRLQLDIYWAAYAGVDPLTYMQSRADRLSMVHLKQMENPQSKRCVDLPDGMLNIPEIIQTARIHGVEDFIVEQEEFAVSPAHSLQRNVQYLKSIKFN